MVTVVLFFSSRVTGHLVTKLSAWWGAGCGGRSYRSGVVVVVAVLRPGRLRAGFTF